MILRVLITEIGNNNSGDESICLGAARRFLAMQAEVTFCYRVSLEDSVEKAGLKVKHIKMPINQKLDNVSTVSELITTFAGEMPDLYDEMTKILADHDLVAVAPGGKFSEGYKIARTLLTAAVALSLGIPVIVLHQSVGPIENRDHINLLSEVFKHCNLILIRDDRSMGLLSKLDIDGNKIVQCRDVAFGEIYPRKMEIDYNLGINIRYGANGHVKLDVLRKFILDYNETFPDDRILVYSTTYNLDSAVVENLSGLPCDLQVKMPSYPDYLRDIGRCEVNVADSFHGSIFSMMAERPVILCQSDYKTWKLEGLPAPEQNALEVLPGLVSYKDAEMLLRKVITVRNNPKPTLDYQRRIVEYGRESCENGWIAVEELLAFLKLRR